jgi:hypothetical protein
VEDGKMLTSQLEFGIETGGFKGSTGDLVSLPVVSRSLQKRKSSSQGEKCDGERHKPDADGHANKHQRWRVEGERGEDEKKADN